MQVFGTAVICVELMRLFHRASILGQAVWARQLPRELCLGPHANETADAQPPRCASSSSSSAALLIALACLSVGNRPAQGLTKTRMERKRTYALHSELAAVRMLWFLWTRPTRATPLRRRWKMHAALPPSSEVCQVEHLIGQRGRHVHNMLSKGWTCRNQSRFDQ